MSPTRTRSKLTPFRVTVPVPPLSASSRRSTATFVVPTAIDPFMCTLDAAVAAATASWTIVFAGLDASPLELVPPPHPADRSAAAMAASVSARLIG